MTQPEPTQPEPTQLEPTELEMVVEIPKGSRNKYEVDHSDR